MDFAIISKESTAYDLQPLAYLRMFLFWKLYFKSLCLITGTHSPIYHPALYPPTKYKQYGVDFPPIWGLRWKTQQVWCVTTVSRGDMEQLRVAYQKNTNTLQNISE